MKLYLLVAIVAVAVLAVRADEDVEAAWSKFKTKFAVRAASAKELEKRKANFAHTHAKIQAHNKAESSFVMSHNALSTLSKSERKALLGAKVEANETRRYFKPMRMQRELPDMVDHRFTSYNCLPKPKDQGGCGSCWAFAATAVVEFGLCQPTQTYTPLSEQQMVDCDTEDGGCDGGWYGTAWEYVNKAGGQDAESSYPYTASGGSCAASNGASAAAKVVSDVEYVEKNDVTAMETVLANNQLLAVAIAVVDSFFSYSYGVYTEADCSKDIQGYHAVAVVGYGTFADTKFWVVRNSWGGEWGEAGYIRMERGVNLCGIEEYAATVKIASP